MANDQLINKRLHILHRNKIKKGKDQFLYNEISRRINQSLDHINIDIKNCLEIGSNNQIIENYIISKFPNLNFFSTDISIKIINKLKSNNLKICFDHDNWPFRNNFFDMIISNCYIHLSNNFELLLNNINKSLNHSGFFIASIPGKNTFNELKDCMMQLDLELYKGIYRRFMESYSIENISNLLKKNDFQFPIIDIDTIELRFSNFKNLLSDIRYMGHTNIYDDKKKNFENKNYFNKLEKLYWNKYSVNNKLIANIEIIYISAWKKNLN